MTEAVFHLSDSDRRLLIELGVRMAAVEQALHNSEQRFVTRAEFAPIKAFVWGMAALILAAVGGAVLKLVILQ